MISKEKLDALKEMGFSEGYLAALDQYVGRLDDSEAKRPNYRGNVIFMASDTNSAVISVEGDRKSFSGG